MVLSIAEKSGGHAKRANVLSIGMVHVIDWRPIGAGSTSAFKAYPARLKSSPARIPDASG
jgi:hypothetical protein